MILLRTQTVDGEVEALAAQLEQLSGAPVTYLIDERHGAVDPRGRAKIGLTRAGCEALGVHCPDDFAWRCGDYGFYLARQAYPERDHFWLIENDVRIAGSDPTAFFAKFADEPAMLAAGYIGDPEPDWPWRATTESSDATPQKCFFPVVRLSADAIDLLLAKRRAHATSWARRRLWPNDEAFVATTLIAAGATTRELNDGSPPVYRTDQFSFATIRDGSLPLSSDATVALFHPVLTGEALDRKRARMAAWSRPSRLARLVERIRRRVGIDAIARRINRGTRW